MSVPPTKHRVLQFPFSRVQELGYGELSVGEGFLAIFRDVRHADG